MNNNSIRDDDVQAFAALFTDAQEYFRLWREELRSYGIEPDSAMELRRSTGMQSYYHLVDGHIYLALPDLQTGPGRFAKLFYKSMLSIDDDETLLFFFRLLIPRLIAHELGHHLRHRYQQFRRENMWHEEQVANQLAMAMIKRRLSPGEKQYAREVLSNAISVLAAKMEARDIAIDSYRNIVHALNVTQQLRDDALNSIEMMSAVFAIDTEDLLRASGQLPEQVLERIEQREDVIGQINEEYTSDAVRYLYYHLGWLYCDLLSQQSDYVDEFAIAHLALTPSLLPSIQLPPMPERVEIRALYRACLDVQARSELGRRFFYKRYRSSLLQRLKVSALSIPNGKFEGDLSQLLEMWEDTDHDPLNYLQLIAPPELKRVFPDALAQSADNHLNMPDDLPTETDRRLWHHFVTGEPDEAAQNVIKRLDVLDETPMLRPLPAEVQLWLAHRMYRLKLESGDPVIWQGEKNSDIFILNRGQLEILTYEDGKAVHLGNIPPGTLFGEMSFITHEARSATVRAIRPSECFVLKGSDLRPMAFNHPALLAQMANTLASKLNAANQRLAQNSAEHTMLDQSIFPKSNRGGR